MEAGQENKRLVREKGTALSVARIAEPVLEDLGFRLVLVRISGEGNSQLQILVERPDGTMTIDECVEVSRNLSPILDVEDPISGKYRLEVSSPGIDRPLVRPNDFETWAGDVAKIEMLEPLAGRRRFKGRLEGFCDGEVRIYVKPDDGSDEDVLVGLPFDQIAAARLVLTDELFDKSRKQAKNGPTSDGSEVEA